MLNPIKKINFTSIVGVTGYGKTVYIKNFLLETDKFIVMDLMGEYSTYGLNYIYFKNLVKDFKAKKLPDKIILNDINNFSAMCDFMPYLEGYYFIVDEIDFFNSRKGSLKSFHNLISYGRHYNIYMLASARRPYDIPIIYTSQTRHFVAFHVNESRDCEFLHRYVDFDDRFLMNLKEFEYIDFYR